MEEPRFEVVAPAGHILGESASWCARTAALWWVDIRAMQVKRWNSASGAIDHWTLPELCGAVVPTTGPEVLVAQRAGIHLLDPRTGALALLATVEPGQPEHRLNEARCDRQGRLWCGSMWDFGLHPTGGLYRITADRATGDLPHATGDGAAARHDAGTAGVPEVTKVRSGVTIPNGIAFSPDGRRMYFTDTAQGHIETAAYDPHSGTPGAWSILVDAQVAPGRPDGGTVDAQGCLWSTRVGAGAIARFTPDGKLDRLLRLPVSHPTSCSFGGAGLDTLFVTSATQRLSPEALAAQPLAGAVLALRPGVQGLPETPFPRRAPTHGTASPEPARPPLPDRR